MTDRANSGVRNLRAMFETQNTAPSPEPRGRSPAGNATSDANRPTSKVRASFVSVEPNSHIVKELGATKGISVNGPQAHRRESFSVSEDLGETAPTELKRVISEEKEEREKSSLVAEAIPEQAVETRESSRAPPPIRAAPDEMPNLGSIMKGSDFPEPAVPDVGPSKAVEPTTQAGAEKAPTGQAVEQPAQSPPADVPAENPDKIVSGAQEEVSLKPADPTDEATVSGGKALPPPREVLAPSTMTEPTPTTPKSAVNASKANVTPATNGKAAVKKPSAISTAKASTAKTGSAKSPLPKSPGVARLPKTPTTTRPGPATSTSKSPAPAKAQPKTTTPKEAAKAPAPRTSRASLKPSTATSATAASSAAKAKAPATETKKTVAPKTTAPAPAKDASNTSPGGFKKPRPRSPTRPVRLPSHLTAPTASSAAKHGEDSATQQVTRKPSTISRPTPKPAPPARKQPSRASLAPSTAPTKRPESRASTKGASDEGFLARMMRPTASSASKTNDKPTSPPRRAPSTRAPAKSKVGSAVAKGKKKVEEVSSKVKEAATNGHHEDKPADHVVDEPAPAPAPSAAAETTNDSGPNTEPAATEPVPEKAAAIEPVREATPVEQPDSSAVELQTPSFEGQAIR